jgi:hypothetical protein
MSRPQTTPKKGDIIINPKTSRPVRVGSKVWLKLVREGLVDGHYSNDDLPPIDERPVLKRQSRVVKRQEPKTDMKRYTAQTASRVVNKNIEHLIGCDDLELELERLIMEEMEGTEPVKKITTRVKKVMSTRGRPTKAKQLKEEHYKIEETEEIEDEYIDMDDPTELLLSDTQYDEEQDEEY